eukprot:CAMPEP_0176452182 /NCGR_PEP_ID=MMETSP0127-20121128/28352_1 /TAXON_ID=938130 /ORGANISM="Platyophrya macrostoma, Strain WH" /LENGTH=64 /DNA_ID=CAMNT_0017840525 /DNA_START=78 /DNA_END=272 /DNA_ORIENTATION=+
MTDAKDAVVDAAAKSKVQAEHAKIDASYNMNKAGVDATKWAEKKAVDMKDTAANVKHDIQKNQF